MRTYKFQLKPNKTQEEVLNRTFDLCRFTYNKLLEELNKQEKVDRGAVQHKIVELKQEFPELKSVYSKTLQYECYRLFSNLQGLKNSKKNGNKVGRLRFKGKNWFKTIIYNQSGFKLIDTKKHYNKLQLSKIGKINIRQHRDIEGNIKGVIIKRKVDSWEAHVITDAEYKIDSGEDVIGIDMGIMSFITTSKNEKIENPLYMKASLTKLQNQHRKISKTKKGSRNRRKQCIKLQKIWEHVDNQKKDFFHKVTTKLINKSKFISVEKLNIKEMTSNKKNKYYNHRNILDSSWGLFLQMLNFKAESAGIKYVEVNPKNTTKMCSKCKKLRDMPLHFRNYVCECGLKIDRDYNAAINILGKGLALVGEGSLESSMIQEAIS
jgi:putative transposase